MIHGIVGLGLAFVGFVVWMQMNAFKFENEMLRGQRDRAEAQAHKMRLDAMDERQERFLNI